MDKRSLLFVCALMVTMFFVHQWFNSKDDDRKAQRAEQTKVEQVQEAAAPLSLAVPATHNGEQFYVLENGYQQLVFSNFGGALAEINLPIRSETNPDSIIRPISFDRSLEKEHPENDHFPASPYFAPGSNQKTEGTVGGYYPLLRRSIVGQRGAHAPPPVAPQFYALNVIADDTPSPGPVYKVKRFQTDLIEFEAIQPHRRIVKTFSFPKNSAGAPFCIDLKIKVEGDARGLWLTTGVPEVELVSGSFSPALKYQQTRNKKLQVEQIDLPKTSITQSSVQPEWISNSNGFLGVIVNPLTEGSSGFSATQIPGNLIPTRLTLVDAQYDLYPADKYPGYEMQLPLRPTQGESSYRIFAGPFVGDVLKTVDATYADPASGYDPNYTATQSFHGWFAFISEPFAKFLFILMKFFYSFTHSWGFSIILLTIALRIMLYPLNAWSIKSTARMQEIAPQVKAIQDRHKKDPKRAQVEVVALYREKGINPMTGCFPILIQMPFLIGMFDLLKSTFELRGASFIPGWIDNLAAPDVLFSWNYPVIFFGTNFHLLPLLLGAVMYIQQKMSSPLPKDKSMLTDQQKQQKMMGNIMAIVFTVMFYHFPSGLNLYWLSSMALGILQQWYTTKKMKNAHITR